MSVLNVEVFLEEEQLQEVFENAEVKYSKAKVKKIKAMLSDVEPDLKERLEEAFMEFIEEMVSEEWER